MREAPVIRMGKIKTVTPNVGGKDREIVSLRHCWMECKMVQPLWKRVWLFVLKLKLVEEEMATHSSILAWEIPRTEESSGC